MEIAWDSEGPKAKTSYVGLREACKAARAMEKKTVARPDRRAAALKAWATIRSKKV